MPNKPSNGLIARGTNFEPATMELGLEQTPLDRFFLCTVGASPTIAGADWSLAINGDGVAGPIALTLDDLATLPQRSVSAWLECAGNGRSMFELLGKGPLSVGPDATPWMLGAMGMADWEGPTVATVLDQAGVAEDAEWVSPAGLDFPNEEGEPVRMTLPIDKAMHPDTIVALSMSGAPLDAVHGFPARLLVPGWIGAYSVKWLGRLEVSSEWITSGRADDYYRLRTEDGIDLGPATAHPVKSNLALDWPATLAPGIQGIYGYARAAGVPIESVEWSSDGTTWHDAELVGPNGEWTWSPFRFEWEAVPGEHQLRSRATDALGNTQPEEMEFHPDGILWNAVIPHPVIVAG